MSAVKINVDAEKNSNNAKPEISLKDNLDIWLKTNQPAPKGGFIRFTQITDGGVNGSKFRVNWFAPRNDSTLTVTTFDIIKSRFIHVEGTLDGELKVS